MVWKKRRSVMTMASAWKVKAECIEYKWRIKRAVVDFKIKMAKLRKLKECDGRG